jgi:hypothetical protein
MYLDSSAANQSASVPQRGESRTGVSAAFPAPSDRSQQYARRSRECAKNLGMKKLKVEMMAEFVACLAELGQAPQYGGVSHDGIDGIEVAPIR